MKLAVAWKIIRSRGSKGYMVAFEVRVGNMLKADHFPDKHAGEDLIDTEEEAWELAAMFARNAGERYVNIYVVDSEYNPVPGYQARKMNRYPT